MKANGMKKMKGFRNAGALAKPAGLKRMRPSADRSDAIVMANCGFAVHFGVHTVWEGAIGERTDMFSVTKP